MRSRLLPAALAALLAITALLVDRAQAQWVVDGTGYGTAANDQLHPVVCPDGTGGAFIAWSDSRSAPYEFDIYVQRVNSVGFPQWTANGVAVSTAAGDQILPQVVPNGNGGVIVAWEDFRTDDADIYVQSIDSMGVVMWTPGGVPLCTQIDPQTGLQLVSDGAGGAIAIWEDFRGLATDIYGQRVNSLGIPRWTANGRALVTADEDQFSPKIVSYGVQGAVFTWFDDRTFQFDVYAQKIDTSGTPQWTANGVPVCVAPGTKLNPVIAADGAGGAVIAWEDFRDDIFSFDIYVQRVASNGARLWTVDGVSLVENDFEQLSPTVCGDGFGGAIVAWQDNRAALPDIYAQRVNSSGAKQWTADGVSVSTAIGTQQLPVAIADNAGGAIILWEDLRASVFNTDIYAQRLDGSGAGLWTPQGLALTAAGTDQVRPFITTDGVDGIIAAWEDGRSGLSSDIYAQRVTGAGIVAPTVSVARPQARDFQLLGAMPNPCWSRTEVRLIMPSAQPVTVEVFDLNGRRVRALQSAVELPPGPQSIVWDSRDDHGSPVSGGLYWLRVSTPKGAATSKVTVLR